jgi:site-specific DNA-methyltransferase (adenine-specific)
MWMTTTKMPKNNKLKPAHEPIVVAQKPFKGTLKDNFEEWGCGIIDTDNTRIPWDKKPPTGWVAKGGSRRTFGKDGKTTGTQKEYGTVDANPAGRYPSNIIGEVQHEHQKYFYAPRATRKEKGADNDHPTVKPVSLMEYLIKIYSPVNSTVLDPFCGSGSTGVAALGIDRNFVGIDSDEHYCQIAADRLRSACPETPLESPTSVLNHL